MKTAIAVIWFVLVTRNILFWVWLWQLKEYHWGRFFAHFEAQALRKISASFWRTKFPQRTKKTLLIVFSGILVEIFFLLIVFSMPLDKFLLWLFVFWLFSPLVTTAIVFLFHIPAVLVRKGILRKARLKMEKMKGLTVIGITGSYGKTSTKEFLAKFLEKKYRVLKTPLHINAEIGIAKLILEDLYEEYQIFVVEIGAYQRGKIKEVAGVVHPTIGILTGINEQHLSTFGSMENIIKGKYELIESLPPDGVAIFNGENKYVRELYKKTKKPKMISAASRKDKDLELDIWAEDIREENGKINFTAVTRAGDRVLFSLGLLGKYNVENVLLAALAAMKMGIPLSEIAETAKELKPIKRALDAKKGIGGIEVFDATYSANFNSVMAHLNYLSGFSGRKIVVMPCLIELGKEAARIHREIGEQIGKVACQCVITTKDYFQEVKKGAESSGSAQNIILETDPVKIMDIIRKSTKEGDKVLLESRVPQKLKQMLIKNGS